MIIHKRWFCYECKREWIEPSTGMYTNSAPLTITGNKRNDLCPICGSGSIEYVQFKPSFIGGDIPRPDSSPLPEEYVEKELEPVQRPHTVGFISNNLIAMIRDETSSN